MSYQLSHHSFRRFLFLLLVPALAGCGKISWTDTSVGVLSTGSTENTQSTGIYSIAEEQNFGYELAGTGTDNHLKLEYTLENDAQDDIQVVIRNLAQDARTPVNAFVGATSNEATMQIAGLVNFFNVPMLIPTADGNTLLPSNNLWAFRLSAPSSAYAQYFFTEVLNQNNLGSQGTTVNFLAGVSLAIIYEQNTFGESAAVATAEAAMAQGIAIAEYKSFPAENPSSDQLTTLVDAVKTQKPGLVYLISSNPGTAEMVVRALNTGYATDFSIAPVILGQAGAFTSESFLNSPESEGMYILRQRWNKVGCPAEITSFYEAQSYGTAYLLNYAVGLTEDTLSVAQNWLSLTNPADKRAKFRETLRDQLKGINLDVPCLGNVAFDNTGQNKLLEFELLTIENGSASVVTPADFLQVLNKRIYDMGSPLE